MLSLRTIVAALDFSVGAKAAIPRAAALAARAHAALHLVHAVGEPLAAPGTDRALRERLEQFAAGVLADGTQEPPALDPPTIAVVHGRTVPAAILHYAATVEADLLVLGTHGRSGMSRLLMGSVAEACVAASPRPVLTVPQGAETGTPSPSAPVLVAVDFSDLGRAALRAGRALADLHGANLELAHVVRDSGPFTGLLPSALDLGRVDAVRAETVRQRLARFAEGVPVRAIHVSLGSPSRMIAALAEARGAGAVVLGTHGRAGVAHAILGSTTGATLQRAPCAVLTVRRPVRRAPHGRAAPPAALSV